MFNNLHNIVNIFANIMGAVPTRLTKALQAIGYSPMVFCVQKLGLKYPTYAARARNGRLTLDDIHTILRETGKSFEDIWPDPLAPARISDSETIPRMALPFTLPDYSPAGVKMIDKIQRHAAKKELPLTPKEEAKKGEDPEMEPSPAPSTFKASGLFSEIGLPVEPDPI